MAVCEQRPLETFNNPNGIRKGSDPILYGLKMEWHEVLFGQSFVLLFKFLLSAFPLLKPAAQLIIITNSIKSGIKLISNKIIQFEKL